MDLSISGPQKLKVMFFLETVIPAKKSLSISRQWFVDVNLVEAMGTLTVMSSYSR